MAFLTNIDSRAQVKGSRDPLALVPVWSFFGRKVVGNLSTVTNSVRGFTTLLLGYHFAREVEDRQRASDGSMLSSFLKFEQLAGYSRFQFGRDGGFRGIERVKRKLGEGKRIWLSVSAEDQILSNQKVYGLWGLYSVPSRASSLLETDETILTPDARVFVEDQYIGRLAKQGFREGRIVTDLIGQERPELSLQGKHSDLCRILAKLHGTEFTTTERAFYRNHLMLGGPKDTTAGLQSQLVALLESTPQNDSPRLYLRDLIREARKRGEQFAALAERLDRVDHLESLITPAAIAFGFLLSRNGQTVSNSAGELFRIWGRLRHLDLDRIRAIVPEIVEALHDDDSGERWLRIGTAFRDGDYESAARLLIEQNSFVMRKRNGSEPWIRNVGGKLDVRFRDESWNVPTVKDIPNLWFNSYFIDSLRAVTNTLREG
jgi:hypothetical protein